MPHVTHDFRAEEARIAAAYARRSHTVSQRKYSCFNPSCLSTVQELERGVLLALARGSSVPFECQRILDIGCGSGFWLRKFILWGAEPGNVVGIDLLPERVDEARSLVPSATTIINSSATNLDLLDASFDLVTQFTAFSSMQDRDMRRQAAVEMLRVMKPRGRVLWYDFHIRKPSNYDVCAIGKRHIRELFPGCDYQFQRITVAPPLARSLSALSPMLYELTSNLKIFCTHYLALVTRRPV